MLYLATYRWRDGEQEYYTRRFVRSAGGMDDAWQKAQSYLSDMWGNKTINDDGGYQPPWGYPIVRVDMCQGIATLEDAVRAIGCVEDYELNLARIE